MVKPVEKTIYTCEGCSKEYFKKTTAERHEKKCLEEVRFNEKMANFSKQKLRIFQNAKTVDELFTDLMFLCETTFDIHFIAFKLSGQFQREVSNSHGSPNDGVANWERSPDRPLGYPGFYGRFSYAINQEGSKKFSVNALTEHGGHGHKKYLHSGTGGAGAHSGSYVFYFFLSDLPNLKLELNKLKLHGVDAYDIKYEKNYADRSIEEDA